MSALVTKPEPFLRGDGKTVASCYEVYCDRRPRIYLAGRSVRTEDDVLRMIAWLEAARWWMGAPRDA
jgi:hypothetical protein